MWAVLLLVYVCVLNFCVGVDGDIFNVSLRNQKLAGSKTIIYYCFKIIEKLKKQ